MKPIRLVPVLVAALLLAAGAMAAACGGGGGASAEEYFQDLQAVADDVNPRSDQNEAENDRIFEDESLGDERRLERFAELWAANVDILDDAVKGVTDVDPPSELEDLHQEFLAALEDLRDALAALSDEVAAFESVGDIPTFFTSREGAIRQVDQAFTEVCKRMEATAADNNVELSLDCEDLGD